MYGIIRFVFGCLVLALGVLLIHKVNAIINKRKYIIALTVFTVLLIPALSFLPFENYFVTFESPEQAYKYMNIGYKDSPLVIDGESSSLVVGNKNGTHSYLIIPRSKEGWKIGTGADTRLIGEMFVDGISVNVYQYKSTSDYYISVFDVTGSDGDITDIYGSKFYSLSNDSSFSDKEYVTYYAHVKNFDFDYQLNVNGQELSFNNSDNGSKFSSEKPE